MNVFALCLSGVLLAPAAGSAQLDKYPSPGADAPGDPLYTNSASSFQEGLRDTVWFGGDDGHGVAVLDGVWDWDDIPPGGDPHEGWTSVDRTDNSRAYFGWVNEDSFSVHGDPVVPVFTGSSGQIWCGIHQDEADARDFPTGMGYQDLMRQSALSPGIPIDPSSEAIDLELRYFNDTEWGYDFTHVYIRSYDDNDLLLGEHLIDSFTSTIGSHLNPAQYDGHVPPGTLSSSATRFRLEFRVFSDASWSDEDGLNDSILGAFAADDITIDTGTTLAEYDFESGPQGWTFARREPVGRHMGIVAEEIYLEWFTQIGPQGDCRLAGNALELIDEEGSPYNIPGHPPGHGEWAISGKIPRVGYDPETWPETYVFFDEFVHVTGWWDGSGVYYRIARRVYPYTTPQNPEPHWGPFLSGSFQMAGLDSCRSVAKRLYDAADCDSLQIAIEVYCRCEDLVPPDSCLIPGDSHGSPLIDNVRVAFIGESGSSVDDQNDGDEAPWLSVTPNPSTQSVRLIYRVNRPDRVRLGIYDAAGRRVRMLLSEVAAPGAGSVVWDGRDDRGVQVDAGIYFGRLELRNTILSQRTVVLR
jgi:hypothetical protein